MESLQELNHLNQITMKKHVDKNSFRQSLLSVVMLGIIIILAVGTSSEEYGLPDFGTEYLNYEYYVVTRDISGESYYTKTEGRRDKYGKWQGPVKIKYISKGKVTMTEEINMVDGLRHGICKTTCDDGSVYYDKYNMDNRREPVKAAKRTAKDISAFGLLDNKYPWFIYSLNAFGFANEHVEAFIDTVETVLGTYEFEVIDFNKYYKKVIDDLEWTVYDSIIDVDSDLSFFQGLDALKNAELRMAVVDSYWSDGKSTHDIINDTYPVYLLSMNDAGVNDQDFDGFCQELDSLMTSYGSLDLEDPFFIDSVDVRMFRALEYIHETGESALKSMYSLKSAVRFSMRKDIRDLNRDGNFILRDLILNQVPLML